MRKLIIALAVIAAISLLAYPVAASEGHDCPEPGPEFGQCVAEMTPHCPLMDGRGFGDCVSGMARA